MKIPYSDTESRVNSLTTCPDSERLEICPLCLSDGARFLNRSSDRHGDREFYECGVCELAFVPARLHLPPDAEMERYLMHDNDPSDAGYRKFLGRLWDELAPRLERGASGLEFGCGPGPALAEMIREDGFEVEKYDLYFFPDTAPLGKKYDFITCTETVEHLRKPMEEFALLDSLLRPGGKLGVMTGILDNRSEFAGWHYHRDPTHIAFYTSKTMRWIADRMGWDIELPVQNVAIFTKRVSG